MKQGQRPERNEKDFLTMMEMLNVSEKPTKEERRKASRTPVGASKAKTAQRNKEMDDEDATSEKSQANQQDIHQLTAIIKDEDERT